MKAVILARVSTKEQEDGHSLEAQIRNLEQYAQQKSFEIIKVYTIIESSTRGERPEFARMIDFIKAQKETVALIVDTVDRLQRGFRETVMLNELFEKEVLELHFVKERNILNKDANSNQKMMWNMSVVMAQSYTDSLSDNVKRSIRHKVANGEWSGPAPLGYLNSIDTSTGKKTIIPDPERSFLIQRFFQDYSTGAYSLSELSRKAREWGLRSRKGNIVSNQTMHDLIQNPFYYGMMRIKGELRPHKYKTLISKELFEACESIRMGRGRSQAASETKYPFILRGLLTCAVSGRKVSCDIKKEKHIYLISRDPAQPNKKIWTNESLILEQIENVFRSLQIPKAVLAEIVSSLKKSHQSEQNFHQTSIQSLRREEDLITKKLDQLLDMFMDEKITQAAYDRKNSQLLQRRKEIGTLLERHNEGDKKFRIALTTLVTLASKAAELFERSTTEEKRQLMGYVFSNLELNGGNLRYALNTPFDHFANLGDYKEWLPGPDSNQRPID